MKKITLILAAAALSLSSQAATRLLLSQDYEGATIPSELGWSCGGGTMSFFNDGFSDLFQFALGQNNGRSATLNWGTEIFNDENGNNVLEDGVYSISFDFSLATLSTNQYNSSVTVYTNAAPTTNQPYCNTWSGEAHPENYLFDITQINDATTYACNGDSLNTQTISAGDWFTVELTVDVNARTVEYTMFNNITYDVLFEGTRTVPESYNDLDISMYAEGIHLMAARYQTTYQVDNVKVSTQTSYDWANKPSVALTRIGKTADAEPIEDKSLRAYTISFIEGEVLNLEFNGETLDKVDYYDTDEGKYDFETSTSGTLKAWTVYGQASSDVVTTEIDCTPIALPAAEASISSVEEGYNKTYTLTVDNSDVPMLPAIYIAYKYVSDDGSVLEGENLTSGSTVDVTGSGTLTLTTAAFGYAPTTVSVSNDKEFSIKWVADFARTSADQITAYGFTQGEDLASSTTSGESNWTARGRLYYYDVNSKTVDDEGNESYTQVKPFGYDADNADALIHRFYIEAVDGVVETPSFIENVTFWDNLTIGWLQNIGVYQNATTNNYNPVTVNNLDESDFVMFNTISDYGSNSVHPYCATADEYYAQLAGANTVVGVAAIDPDVVYSKGSSAVSKTYNEDTNTWNVIFPLYRIDTALTKITVFADKNGAGIADVINDAVENNDPYYYTIDGLRLLEPTHTGLYIHQGKKVYIVK